MPDTTVKLQDITPVKSTFDNDDQLLLINPTGEARINKEDFLDAMPDDAITLIGDITTTGIEGDTAAKQLGALENSKAPAITETTESSAIANFTDGADDMVMHNVVAEINPVQSGSGDPSPDNIRPITGWTGCNVTRAGKNLFDFRTFADNYPDYCTYDESTGELTVSAYGPLFSEGVSVNIPLDAFNGGYFQFDAQNSVSSSNFRIRVVYEDGTISEPPGTGSQTGFVHCATYLYAKKVVSVRLNWSNGGTFKVKNVSISPGMTATAYEPYSGTTYPISWQSEAGTVYGGTIDVATGLLTVEYVKKTVTSFGGTWGAVTNGYGYYAVFNDTKHDPNFVDPDSMKSNIFKYNREERSLMPLYSYGGNSGGDTTQTFILPSTVTTLADANAWLADNPTECTFKLATPQTYQLTGQQLKTLYGTNNVWADTGDVSVTYPADTKMFIEKLTMPTEDDLVANQAITSGKYFMIGNSLYLALANIASGATIIEGTNATRLSLADALNRLS